MRSIRVESNEQLIKKNEYLARKNDLLARQIKELKADMGNHIDNERMAKNEESDIREVFGFIDEMTKIEAFSIVDIIERAEKKGKTFEETIYAAMRRVSEIMEDDEW